MLLHPHIILRLTAWVPVPFWLTWISLSMSAWFSLNLLSVKAVMTLGWELLLINNCYQLYLNSFYGFLRFFLIPLYSKGTNHSPQIPVPSPLHFQFLCIKCVINLISFLCQIFQRLHIHFFPYSQIFFIIYSYLLNIASWFMTTHNGLWHAMMLPWGLLTP